MPRVIKHPELRRAALLDLAFALFLARGFEHVSLNDLIAEAGISKGAFYHYFDSKEALLAALVERSAREVLAELEPIFQQPGLTALQRLNAGLAESYRAKMARGAPERVAAVAALFRPENAGLYARLMEAWEALYRPLLTELIAQGVADGVFHTFDPEGVGDMIQDFAASAGRLVGRVLAASNEAERQQAIDVAVMRLRLHGIATDRVLGLPDGSVTVLERSQVEALTRALPRAYQAP